MAERGFVNSEASLLLFQNSKTYDLSVAQLTGRKDRKTFVIAIYE